MLGERYSLQNNTDDSIVFCFKIYVCTELSLKCEQRLYLTDGIPRDFYFLCDTFVCCMVTLEQACISIFS